MMTSRLVTPSLFAVAAILFLLPFFSVSCTGQLAAGLRDMGVEPSNLRFEVTGSELVLETVPDRLRNPTGSSRDREPRTRSRWRWGPP